MSDEARTEIIVPEGTPAGRFDKILSGLCEDHSRARLKTLIEQGAVKVNGSVLPNPKAQIESGDVIVLDLPPVEEALPQPENIPIEIVYEDDDLLVINKQAGLTVHPGAGQKDGTLVNALLYHCGQSLSGIGGVARPGIVHRIDKDTSGLMVVAKNDKAHRGLTEQLSDRSLSRKYTAFVWKVPSPIKGTVDAPIGRHKTQRVKMAVFGASAREARTHYLVLEPYGEAAAKIECTLESGRTHQIRVHMAHIKHPLLGDSLYGLAAQNQGVILNKAGAEEDVKEAVLSFPRQALHAGEIGFIHPFSGEEMAFTSPLPEELCNLEILLKTIG